MHHPSEDLFDMQRLERLDKKTKETYEKDRAR
jgi:hypothetical protein